MGGCHTFVCLRDSGDSVPGKGQRSFTKTKAEAWLQRSKGSLSSGTWNPGIAGVFLECASHACALFWPAPLLIPFSMRSLHESHILRKLKGAIVFGWEIEDGNNRLDSQGAIHVRKEFCSSLQVLVTNLLFHFGGLDAKQHKTLSAFEQEIGHGNDLLGCGTVDEALCPQAVWCV